LRRRKDCEKVMKLDTEEKKLAYLLGYVQALAEQHAEEFDRDISEVKKDILETALLKKIL
jgi:hypothetical protein